MNNIKPENRAYLYDFFYDNCATKIKDVTKIALSNTVVFNEPKDFKPETFRTLIQNNLNKNSWGSFGIDLALGSVIDKKASAEENMFLPENIFRLFSNATIKSRNEPLVKESRILYNQLERRSTNQFLMSPLFVFGILGVLMLFITYKDFKNNKRSRLVRPYFI